MSLSAQNCYKYYALLDTSKSVFHDIIILSRSSADDDDPDPVMRTR